MAKELPAENESDKNSGTRKEEKKRRIGFGRLLGKYDFRNEEQFTFFWKLLIFIVLLFVEGLVLLEHINNFKGNGGWLTLSAIIFMASILTLSEGLKLFVVKEGKTRVLFYALDAFVACVFLFLTNGAYPTVLYMVVLTEFYMSAKKARQSILLLCISTPVYAGSYALHLYLQLQATPEAINLLSILTEAFGSVFVFFLHFVIIQTALAFYRQFLRLDKTLKELDESKKELEKAYAVVAEVTALEERQRIAKDIHDTAGHSLTTVIMQTEAAKLIIDKNPLEAKQKLVSANLQAKHALEELRDSVHLLSGIAENQTLKSAMEGILHESTDGTGIKIRSEIDELQLSPAKARFLCNTLKEGISNGLRHGGATAFWFEMKEKDGKIEFLLSDNGKGVQGEEIRLGFGLSTMRDRAKSLGGEIRFDSDADEGFEIRLTMPLDPVER